MFMKNENIRSVHDNIIMSNEDNLNFAKCMSDIFEFAKYFYIIMAGIGFAPIRLREYQTRVIKALVAKVEGKNNRIIMQGRQTGKTTIASLYLLWLFLFEKDKTFAILANKEDQALEIMSRIQNAYLKLPMWLQCPVLKWTQSEILLSNGNRMFTAASSCDSIRGKSVSYMLVDEFAHLDAAVAKKFMDSVFPTQAADPDANLILISTPNGTNQFYDTWQKARAGINTFVPIMVQWYEVPGRDEKFKERIVKDLGIRHFMQEYACVTGDSIVKVRNKRNNAVFKIKTADLYKKLSSVE